MVYEKLATWLEQESEKIDYGEVIIRTIRHAGRTVRIERTITVKEQPAPTAAEGGAK